MRKKIETSTIRTVAMAMALSSLALSVSPTISSLPVSNSIPQFEYDERISLTDTISVIDYFDMTTPYQKALSLYGDGLRDFSAEEKEEYEKSLDELYKPIGLSVFDIC